MTQSPLSPDIVPEPDESKWDIFDKDHNWLEWRTSKQSALNRARELADLSSVNIFICVAVEISDSREVAEQKRSEKECVRPFGLPW